MSDVVRILLAEPSSATVRILRALLDSRMYKISVVATSELLLEAIRTNEYAVIILAADLPGVSTMELVESIVRLHPDTQVVVSTVADDADTALRSIRVGAFDVLNKDPLDALRARSIIKRAVERFTDQDRGLVSNALAVFETADSEQLPQALVTSILQTLNAVTVRLVLRASSGEFDVLASVSKTKARPLGRELDLALGPELTSGDGPLRLPAERHDPRVRALVIPDETNCLIVSIYRETTLIGFLSCHRKPDDNRFSRREAHVGTVSASICALAVEARHGTMELNRRHQTLLGAWRRIVEAQRLEAMGRQAAALALKVQNPISYIEGHLEVVREFLDGVESGLVEANGVDGVRRSVADALSGLRRIGLTATEMSRLARARDDVDFELSRAIDGAIRLAENLNAEVVVRVDDVILRGNMGRFSQAITHLLVNADEAMVGAKVRKISIYTNAVKGDQVELMIEDCGKGIAVKDLTRVTEPFYTTKEPEAGDGLGLSTARDVVEQLGGVLTVNSEPERGTKISIKLPIVGAPEELLELGE
jgi:signal transduction histidine kinase